MEVKAHLKKIWKWKSYIFLFLREEYVEFEAGLKRGKVFVPVLSKEEEEEERKKAEIAEKVK